MSAHNKPRDSSANASSNSIIVTKTSKSLTKAVASSVDSAFAAHGRDDGTVSFDFLMVSFSPEMSSFLLIMWRDAPLSTKNCRSSWWHSDSDATICS